MRVSAGEVALAVEQTNGLGDFFHLAPHGPEGEWLRLDALLDPAVLDARIAMTSQALAGMAGVESVEPRVAASTVALGLFARLVSPPFGALVLTGVLPHVSMESLHWQQVLGGAMPLSLAQVEGVRPEDAAAAYDDLVVAGVIAPLLAAFRATGVSPVVLLGNVASALGGAARMLSVARPDLGDAAWSLVRGLLARATLTGTADLGPHGLRRNSCCLFYRVPGGGFCGDCILADRGALRR